MPISWEQIVVDSDDPHRLARWWAEALGYEIVHEAPDEVEIRRSPDELPGLLFGACPDPKTVKNRLHIDVPAGGGRTVPLPERTARIEARATELEAIGARRLRVLSQDGLDHYGVVMADPEDNEFCVH